MALPDDHRDPGRARMTATVTVTNPAPAAALAPLPRPEHVDLRHIPVVKVPRG